MTVLTKTAEKAHKEDSLITLDEIMENIGVGLWSYIIFIASGVNVAVMATTLIASEYTAPKLDFVCADSLGDDSVTAIVGTECSVLHTVQNSSEVLPCESYIFDNSTFSSTVTEQFSLVCDRASLLPLYQIITTLGGFVGQLFGGVCSEKVGRAIVLWWMVVVQVACLLLISFSPVYAGILVGRFFLGVGAYISCNVAFTIGMEVCPRRYRSFYGILYALPYAIMMIVMAGTAYALRDWQPLTYAMATPLYCMVLLANPWVLDESPRYLMSKKRLKDAERVLRRAARLNGGELPTDLTSTLARVYQTEHAGHDDLSLAARIKSLVATRQMLRLTCVQAVMWLALGTVYMYIPLRVDSFSSPYLTMGLLGLVEIPAYTLIAPITARFGRRSVISCALLVGGAIVLANNIVVAMVTPEAAEWSTVVSDITAYMFFCAAWQTAQTHRAEVFPTTTRSVASSVTYSVASIGFVLPPFLDTFMETVPENLKWTQTTAYGLMAFIAAVIVFKIPETNKKPLKETVPEYVHNINEKKLKKYNNKITKIIAQNRKLQDGVLANSELPEATGGLPDPTISHDVAPVGCEVEGGCENVAYENQKTLTHLSDGLRVSESRSFSHDIFTVERTGNNGSGTTP